MLRVVKIHLRSLKLGYFIIVLCICYFPFPSFAKEMFTDWEGIFSRFIDFCFRILRVGLPGSTREYPGVLFLFANQ